MSTLTAAVPLADAVTEKVRIVSIDIVRGAVMIIMALDHVRDFFLQGALTSDPTNLQTTTPQLFFTRWITHYCAPTFVMLAGTSIYISTKRKPKGELSMFLLTRGLWLILLEVVVVRFGLFFNFYYDVTVFQVIWAIGASMVLMSLLIHLSYRTLLIIGLSIIFFHNLTDLVALKPGDSFYVVWGFLRQSGFFNITPSTVFWVPYPVLPWLGIMIFGFCLGKLYTDYNAEERKKKLLMYGLITTCLFIMLRFINLYGDPAPWSVQKNALYTLISFLNTTKYPVALLYALMTLGPVMIILSLLENVKSKLLKPLIVFGRVPLFYYLVHFYLIHVTSLLFFMNKTGKSFSEIDFHFDKGFGGLTAEGGYSLGAAYLVWTTLVVLLYPLCNWYNNYKSSHSHWWLSYL
jgi:uncharacterized membrane protein